MTEQKKDLQKNRDALDTLRQWIKLQKDTPYGSIKLEVFWEKHIPIKIEIKQGTKRAVLTSNTDFD